MSRVKDPLAESPRCLMCICVCVCACVWIPMCYIFLTLREAPITPWTLSSLSFVLWLTCYAATKSLDFRSLFHADTICNRVIKCQEKMLIWSRLNFGVRLLVGCLVKDLVRVVQANQSNYTKIVNLSQQEIHCVGSLSHFVSCTV